MSIISLRDRVILLRTTPRQQQCTGSLTSAKETRAPFIGSSGLLSSPWGCQNSDDDGEDKNGYPDNSHLLYLRVSYLFIGPESDHCFPLSLTESLTHSCLVNFIDVTLACEDANSKLVDVVTVADDDRVGNNLL